MGPHVAITTIASLLLLAQSACATASVDIGYSVPTSGDEGYDAWVLEGRVASGGIVKFGVAARSRLGEERDQIALAPELSVEMSPGPVTAGVRLGVHVAQLDYASGDWTFGLGTPYLQPLLQFRVGDPVFLFVGATLEYNLHTGDGEDQLYVGGQLGVGIDL